MTTFLIALYILTIIGIGLAYAVATIWHSVACNHAVSYATSPPPTLASVVGWYSSRAARALAGRIARKLLVYANNHSVGKAPTLTERA